MEEQEQKGKNPRKLPDLRPALEYSSLGIQIAAIIFLGAYLGKYLDERYQTSKNWFTLGLVLFSVAVAMYFALRQLNAKNKKK